MSAPVVAPLSQRPTLPTPLPPGKALARSAQPLAVSDSLTLTVSPEATTEVNKVESQLTYWGLAASALEAVSLLPRAVEVNANGLLSVLQAYGYKRTSMFFELAERGSKWMRLDPKAIRTLEETAAHLTPAQALGLKVLRGAGGLLMWTNPAFAAWDVFKAVREHNPLKRERAVGNAVLSVLGAVLSFEFPLWSFLVVAGQTLDARNKMRFTGWIGHELVSEWRAHRAADAKTAAKVGNKR